MLSQMNQWSYHYETKESQFDDELSYKLLFDYFQFQKEVLKFDKKDYSTFCVFFLVFKYRFAFFVLVPQISLISKILIC